jgi:hypothetical protein
MLIAAVLFAALVVGGVAYATIPDSGGVIHGCYTKSGGTLRVIDASVTNCKTNEVSLNWSQQGVRGPPGAPGAPGPPGQTGPPGPTGPGVDLTGIYRVNSAIVHVAASFLGTVNADCNNGDVAVGGNYGVNGGSNFSVYFDGTHIIPANIGSTTLTAGYYSTTINNSNNAEIIIFATVYCVSAS